MDKNLFRFSPAIDALREAGIEADVLGGNRSASRMLGTCLDNADSYEHFVDYLVTDPVFGFIREFWGGWPGDAEGGLFRLKCRDEKVKYMQELLIRKKNESQGPMHLTAEDKQVLSIEERQSTNLDNGSSTGDKNCQIAPLANPEAAVPLENPSDLADAILACIRRSQQSIVLLQVAFALRERERLTI